jgi:alkylated DNA repair dioxygenase AlkB
LRALPAKGSLEHMYGEQMFVLEASREPQGDERWKTRPGDETVRLDTVEWQASLFAAGDPGFDPSLQGVRRLALDETSWLDHLPRWLEGSDHVFAEIVARLPWRQRTVPMYDRLVQEPRLVWWWTAEDGPSPLPLLEEVGHALSHHYGREFDSIGCNYYRTGSDSVAWHGDRMRHTQVDPLVAIVSVGAPRPFLLRPRGGGHSISFLLGQGDLLAMGGAVQHDWEHTVPKVAAAGPRISITYRHGAGAPTAVRGRLGDRAHHPSAGAQNRHLAATGSEHRPGRLEARGADRRTARPPVDVPDQEGPPS